MRLLLFLTVVYALACGLFYRAQFKEVKRLRQEQARMGPVVEEVVNLRKEHSSPSWPLLDQEELDRLRSAHRELIKLRGQVASLRQFASMDSVQIQSEIESLEREEVIEVQSAEVLEARQRALKLSKETKLALRTYIQTIYGASDGAFATSFDELERSVLENPKLPWFLKSNLKDLKTMSLVGESVLNLFEILPEAVDARKYGVETLLLREKRPRALPDGGWTRAYASSDATVLELTSESPDFTEAEQELTSSFR